MRLIDGDNVKENLQYLLIDELGDTEAFVDGVRQGIELAIAVIDEHLTVEHIIRCKECKQWDAELGCCTSYTIVKCTDGREGVSSDADDFCSKGEKKDEID